MKKILAIIAVMVFAVTLSGCLPKKKTEEESEAGGVVEEEKGILSKIGKKSYTFKALKAAIELGIPLKCSYKVNDIKYEGYIKGKQWRGKMKGSEGRVVEIIMSKDNCMYSWEEGKTMGMKMCFDEDMWESEEYQETTPDMEYLCVPAAVTDAKFNPPSNINFMEMGGAGTFGPGQDSMSEEDMQKFIEQYQE